MSSPSPFLRPSRHPGRLPRGIVLRALLTQRSAPGNGHPKIQDRGRALVANLSFLELLGVFAVLFLVAAAIGGLALDLTEPSGRNARSYLHWLHESAMALAGSPLPDVSTETDDDARRVAQGLIAFGSVLLPGIVLGGIIFRLFVRERTLVFRQRPALVHFPGPGGREWRLVLRLYPATYLLLLDLAFTVFVQRSREDPDGGLVLNNTPVTVLNERWPVGDTHSPYSLTIPLHDDDVEAPAAGGPRVLRAIRGLPVDADTQLIVHAVGHVPELGAGFTEHHRVALPYPLHEGGYFGVTVQYDGRGPSWDGWEHFERVRQPERGTKADG